MRLALIMTIAFALDMLIGSINLHPALLMKEIIYRGQNIIKNKLNKNKVYEFIGVTFFSLSLCIISFLIPFFLLKALYGLNFILGFVLETFFCYLLIAMRELIDLSSKVYKDLEQDDIISARKSVSIMACCNKISYDKTDIIKTAVKNIYENTSSKIIAPLFFIFIGGAPLGFLYMTINTLNSMIEGKNEKYIYFEKFVKTLEEILIFLPSKILSLLYISSSSFLKYEKKTASEFSSNGDIKKPENKDIIKANKLALVSSLTALFIFCVIRLILSIFEIQ